MLLKVLECSDVSAGWARGLAYGTPPASSVWGVLKGILIALL